jgi:hypothetical protein
MKFICSQLLALSPLLLGLTGCGSDSKTEPEPIAATQKISGVAVDGYLAMAKACIDINNNFQCDGDSEYQVLTDQDGRFEIVAPDSLSATAPLLVTTSAGITIDSDHPEQAISQAYYLLSDYKKPEVVSPLTTLVYAKKIMLGDSTKAEKALVQQLGLTDSSMLYSDFVAAKNDTNLTVEQKQEYSKIHLFSQVVTDIISQGLAQSATNTSDEEKPQVAKLFTDKLANFPVEKVIEQVDDAISTGGETSTLAALFLQTTPSLIVSKSEIDNGEITPVIIPEPVTPDPVTPDPVTPDPVTPDPVTPDPVTPDPVTPDPVTPDPVTPDPVTPDPVTPDPVTPDPVTPDPVTPDPVTPDPVTPDPVTPDPVTPDPVTPDPVTPDPAAPTNAVIDDSANTFGWTLVSGYNKVSDYQYSTDNGSNWQDVNANPQLLTNQYYPVGTVQVRVKADSSVARNAGDILASEANFFIVPSAPSNGVIVNGGVSTSSSFGFDLVTTFSELNNYQFSSDTGNTWQAVSVNPIVLAEKAYAINQVQVRVTSNLVAGNLAGTALSNQEAFIPELSPVPKAVLIEYLRINNGVSWQLLGEYPKVNQYEYTNDKGHSWHQAVSTPQHIGHLAYAKEDVGIRVKASETNPAGEIVWASEHSDVDYVFENYAYTWRTQQRITEALDVYGRWDETDTSCLIDHNAATPTYWLKIGNVRGNDAEDKVAMTIAKQACGISDWQLLSVADLITLAQTELDTELADFEGSYDKFLTKNDVGDIVFVNNAVLSWCRRSTYQDKCASN